MRAQALARSAAAVAAFVAASGCAAPPPAHFPIPFHIIAHRGASAYAPENSLPAFERALALGAFEVELDVRRSRDGVLFLFHDRSLDEKTNGRGNVAQSSAEELRRVEIGSWFDREHPELEERFAGTRLVTLRELFEHFGGRLFYHIEIKGSEESIPRQVAELVRSFELGDRVMITSFSIDQLRRSRAFAPELSTCWLLERVDDSAAALVAHERWIERARDEGFAQVGIAASDIGPEAVAFAHRHGLELRGWGVKSEEHIARVIDAGANGMTIDWPDQLIERLLRHQAGL